MTPKPIELHPLAIAEARAARRWYATKSQAVSKRFVEELDLAVSRIATLPDSWPPHLCGTRAYRLRRFPYLVVYLELADSILIVAVAHGHRKPGYWRKRLP